MRRINLPLILDTLFFALCAFLIFFTSMRFYTRNAYLALGFGIAACLLFGSLCFILMSRKQHKKLLISKNEKEKKLLSLHLSLSGDEYITSLFAKSIDGNSEVKNDKIFTDERVFYFNFKMHPLDEDDVAKVIKHKSELKKTIYCCKVSPEAALLAERFLIELKGIDYIYDLLKKKDLLPEKYVYTDPQKISILKRIRSRFTRKLCAPLFTSGLALLALSYFTFFPIYYIVSGGILLSLSAVALAFN